ncbi:MerR family transcriptional regulator [Saccharomonospora halophila]|uniref:MerR family transcriptional regulator n=1 Tax=Saccharomonospora halophila TaxID=129922 RepID=UPI00039CB5D2|nr:MerR family transcriptional regulator [Saccharomonospora halophila]
MHIGELAERTGASRRSIRHYEQQGLLEPRRTSSGWREYDELAVNRVLNLRELLKAGLSLSDIRQVSPCLDRKTSEFLNCDDPDEGTIAMYERRLSDLDAKAAELQRYRTDLVDRLARLRASASDAEEFASLLRRHA